ncbi:hypothetical protein M1N20_00110 [Dehalococcoidia bacterium]|nr:hypothetical protein [Dehalococcoidia bacterium]
MKAVETALQELLKSDPKLLEIFRVFCWGKIEIVVKDGKPVMVSVRRDIKLE